MDQDKSIDIHTELARLQARKTEFLRKTEHTFDEFRAYAESRDRFCELFAELAQSGTAMKNKPRVRAGALGPPKQDSSHLGQFLAQVAEALVSFGIGG